MDQFSLFLHKSIEYLVGPNICGDFGGMLEFWNAGKKIDIVPIVPVLHHSSIPIPRSRWSDPPFVLGYELDPMRRKDGRNMITDMSCGAQHNIHLE